MGSVLPSLDRAGARHTFSQVQARWTKLDEMKPCRVDAAGRAGAQGGSRDQSSHHHGVGQGLRHSRQPGRDALERVGSIGVFDSGLGGLTVVRALREHLPEVNFVYLGDTARVPYGTKHSATVVRYAESCAARLVDAGISHLVVACNTASAWALGALQDKLSIPVTGVLDASARVAVDTHQEGAIAVLATPGTVRSEAYAKRIAELRPEAEVISVAAPLLVGLAEEGWIEGPIVDSVIERYLAPLRGRRVDTLVLGCTHFPLFSQAIAACAARTQGGAPVRLVSSGAALCTEVVAACRPRRAHALAPNVESNPRRDVARKPANRGTLDVWLTDYPEHVRHVIDAFLGPQGPVRHVAHVELEAARLPQRRAGSRAAGPGVSPRESRATPRLQALG